MYKFYKNLTLFFILLYYNIILHNMLNECGGGEAEIYDDSLKRENDDELENKSRKKIKCDTQEKKIKFRFVPKPETICSSFCEDSNSFIQNPFDEISNIFFDSTFSLSEVYTSNGRSLFLIGTNQKEEKNLIFIYHENDWFGTTSTNFKKIDTNHDKMRGKIKFQFLNRKFDYCNREKYDLEYWKEVLCDSSNSFQLKVSIPDNKWGNVCDITTSTN